MVGVLRGDLDPVVKSELGFGFGFQILTHIWIRPKYLDSDPDTQLWLKLKCLKCFMSQPTPIILPSLRTLTYTHFFAPFKSNFLTDGEALNYQTFLLNI